jgi:enterochelin esterase-like enzyme
MARSRTDTSPDALSVGDPRRSTGRAGRRWSRRRVLTYGLASAATVVAAGAVATELVSHDVLPGKRLLDQFDGACSVPSTRATYSTAGPQFSGAFYSAARNRTVGYTIAYPSGYHPGDPLPLIVTLHAFGGNHTNALDGVTPAQALALRVDNRPLPPMAMVTADGGRGYWNPHPGDDPMAMVIHELIPRCQHLGLGRAPQRIGTLGISMGGYGALLLAERDPRLISAVAAISPAIWTTYGQARNANPGAYATAADFATDDAVTHASALNHTAVRIAVGDDDPFYPGVVILTRALPPQAIVEHSHGCHTSPFFRAQQPLSLQFLAEHLAA